MVKFAQITFLSLFINSISFSQDIKMQDSLTNLLQTAKHDTTKIETYLQFALEAFNYDLKKAQLYIDSASSIARQYNLPEKIMRAKFAEGTLYFYLGDYRKALDNYLLYLEYFEKRKDDYLVANVKLNIASILIATGDFDKALEYLFSVLKLFEKEELRIGKKISAKSKVTNNIALVYSQKKEYNKALKYYKIAVDLGLKSKKLDDVAMAYNNMGLLYQDMQQNDTALFYLNNALQIRKENNDFIGLPKSYLYLGDFYFNIKNYSSALENLNNALEASTKVEDLATKKDILFRLFQTYEILKDFDSALNAHKEYKAINDSIMSVEVVREITRKSLTSEFESKEELFKLKQKEKDLIYLITASILVSIIIIFILLYFLTKNRNKRIKLNQENLELQNKTILLEKEKLEISLEYKNKELTTNIMYLIQKNELINKVITQLLELKRYIHAKNQTAYQNIISELQSGASENLWEEFEVRFEQIYSGFPEKLRTKYPNLSPSEVKMCIFLRLNLTSKEISGITHQNVRAIEIARYRIRKKLNLSNQEVSLVNFLMDI